MNVLGISAFYHDSAAALMVDGELVAAAQEERFSRIRHDEGFPEQAVAYCLDQAGLTIDDIDAIGFYDKPLIKFERLLLTYLATWPFGVRSFINAMPVWLGQKLWIPSAIRKHTGFKGEILYGDHHLSHAASAFLLGPFDNAAILTVDGVGEWSTTTWGTGRGSSIELSHEIRFPHSLGMLYSAFTYYLGFKVNSAEYKVMGLAPYGEPKYAQTIFDHVIDLRDNGSFALNMDLFSYHTGLRMTNRKFAKLFGAPARPLGYKPEQREMDLAASVQAVTEEVVLRLCRHIHAQTGLPNLCLAGGVALNCVANGRVVRETPFEEVHIQPAAGDAGGAVGVAAWISRTLHDIPRKAPARSAYLGPAYSDEEIEAVLTEHGAPVRRLDDDELLRWTAKRIGAQQVVGWFQGRMEFGPRALGNRSILADPRNPDNQDVVNLKIKFRESFRPFAPTVLDEAREEYFDLDRESPYMLLVAQVREDKEIPAVTHVDGSARIQTICRDDNPRYHALLGEWQRQSGCAVLINTSFNVRGEPIVCTPDDAFGCFMATHMDVLVMGNYVLEKADVPALLASGDWQREFEAD